jgi:hypothetical protein
MDAMWSEPRLADAFLKDNKGWQKDLAASLSIPQADLERGVNAIGVSSIKKMLANHPAGVSPAVEASQPFRRGMGTSMNTNAMYCQTGNSCGTCVSGCNVCIGSKAAHAL